MLVLVPDQIPCGPGFWLKVGLCLVRELKPLYLHAAIDGALDLSKWASCSGVKDSFLMANN